MSPDLKKKYRRFMVSNLILAVVLFVVWLVLFKYTNNKFASTATPWIILFFLALNLTLFYFQLKATLKRFSKFVNLFLATTTLKLLVFLTIIISYSFIYRDDAVPFIFNFFAVYLLFTLLEVVQIMNAQKELRNKLSNDESEFSGS